jgi:hypothetical protein
MNRDDDERLHALLGKHLLGRATADEIRELRARRDADAAFREAMDFAERSAGDFRRSAVGEDVRVSSADLPDWLRPAELARGLEAWYWRWLLATVGSAVGVWTMLVAAAVNLAPHDDPSRIARLVYLPGAVTLAALVVSAWFARERLAAGIAAGGPPWERAVAAVRDQESRFLSPRGRASMLLGGGFTATALAVAATLPRFESGIALLVATVCLAFTLRIAKRRLLLRGLRGERGWPS